MFFFKYAPISLFFRAKQKRAAQLTVPLPPIAIRTRQASNLVSYRSYPYLVSKSFFHNSLRSRYIFRKVHVSIKFNLFTKYNRRLGILVAETSPLHFILYSLLVNFQWFFFSKWVKGLLQQVPVLRHRVWFYYLRTLLQQNVNFPLKRLAFVSIRFKGKLAAAGNSRKRRFYILAQPRFKPTPGFRVKVYFTLIFTSTGVFSMRGSLKYSKHTVRSATYGRWFRQYKRQG